MPLSRRNVLKGAGAAMALSGGGCTQTASKPSEPVSRPIDFDISAFYTRDGQFNVNAAKQAYITLLTFHGYAVPSDPGRRIWVSDFGKNHFPKLGFGAIVYVNDRRHRYMMMDFFLLPGQMMPEHYQVGTEDIPAPKPSWLVRHGSVFSYSEGKPTANRKAQIPWSHLSGTVITQHEQLLHAGEDAQLGRTTAPHWHYGGPDGAVVTETASFYDVKSLRFTDQTLVFDKNLFLQTDQLL